MMTFDKAIQTYKSQPTKERLYEVSEQLLREMTVKEKIRLLQGHAMGVTVKNFITKNNTH